VAGRTTEAPKCGAILKSNSKPVKGVELKNRVIVAVGPGTYKAASDFVFFGGDKNDNNYEEPAIDIA
jgi:hypothetical protein